MDPSIDSGFIDMVLWLKTSYPEIDIYIEEKATQSLQDDSRLGELKQAATVLSDSKKLSSLDIDFLISMGGDGTLLHTCTLFPANMPPVLGFRSGTLNFLVPFKFDPSTYQTILTNVIQGKARVNLRGRISWKITRKNGKAEQSTALNEVAITRGCNPNLCKVLVSMDGQHLAKVEGDGLLQ